MGLFALSALLTLSSAVASGEAVVSSEIIAVAHAPSRYQVGVTVFNLAPEDWSAADIAFQISEANRVYRQCDVQIERITSVTLRGANYAYDFGDMGRLSRVLVERGYFDDSNVNLFFVDHFTGQVLEDTQSGVAINASWAVKAKPFYADVAYARNSAWLTRTITTSWYKKALNPRYSPLAHEMAHLLPDAPHISETNVANVLSGNSLRNDQFTPAQCEGIRASRLVGSRSPSVQTFKSIVDR